VWPLQGPSSCQVNLLQCGSDSCQDHLLLCGLSGITVPVRNICSSMGSPGPEFLTGYTAPMWALQTHSSCQDNQVQHGLVQGHSSCQENMLQYRLSKATISVRRTCSSVGSPWARILGRRTCFSMGAVPVRGTCSRHGLSMGHSSCQEKSATMGAVQGQNSCYENQLSMGWSRAMVPVRHTYSSVGSPESVAPSEPIHWLQGGVLREPQPGYLSWRPPLHGLPGSP